MSWPCGARWKPAIWRCAKARTSFYPELYTQAFLSYVQNDTALEQTIMGALIGIKVNLFDGFATTATTEKAVRNRSRNQDALRQAESQVRLEIEHLQKRRQSSQGTDQRSRNRNPPERGKPAHQQGTIQGTGRHCNGGAGCPDPGHPDQDRLLQRAVRLSGFNGPFEARRGGTLKQTPAREEMADDTICKQRQKRLQPTPSRPRPVRRRSRKMGSRGSAGVIKR